MAEMPRIFTATTEIQLASPTDVMQRLCARFREFGEISGQGKCRRIETGFGTADVEDCGRCLKICAAGKDEVGLAYVKLAMAEHLLGMAIEQPSIVWEGDGAAGAPLPYFREMRVVKAVNITPRMRRLTLAGEDLERFAAGGYHVRLLFPRLQSATPKWPVMGADGRPNWPVGDDKPDVRIYTMRNIDVARGEVEIDFVLHDGDMTPGARFAAGAQAGDLVGMTGPGGGATPAADWYLLLGDETALPAIARLVENLPAGSRAVVRVEVENSDEIQPLTTQAALDVQWFTRDGAAPGGRLPAALSAVDWPSDERRVFAWAGCEFQDFLNIRKHLRNDRKLSREQHLAVAYWRRGFCGDEARKDG